MLEIYGETKINCSLEKLLNSMKDLNNIYTLYCPDEHIKCKYIRGNPLEEGSIIYFEEYIAGKKHKMKYKVYKVINNKNVIFIAMFPKSIFNIKVIFEIKEINDGIFFSRIIQLGTKTAIIRKMIDSLFLFLIGKDYYNAMIEHNEDDLNKLKYYIENSKVENE